MGRNHEPDSSDAPLRDIFWEALQRQDQADRKAYLDEACAGNPKLREQVESLLAALASPPRDVLTESVLGETLEREGEHSGDVIGRYRLIERLGIGGFGVVWRAEQTEPVKREVALKIIKLGMDTKEVIARFEAERQALALMEHPNIARVYDAGATETGRPYFVMDLIVGESITDYCDRRKLPVAQRLELFVQVCDAVQHAHARGIVHRDLKPSNVVVVEENGKPLVKVIDFGIAKSMQGRLTDRTLVTRREVLLGTPVYMSPEQLNLDADTVDARSDVYSLGVLLYELIAGAPPFESDTLRKAAFSEVQRILREVEPEKPSTRFEHLGPKTTEIAQRRAIEPPSLQRLLRGDLDWVVMRALEKEPARRYASAAALAEDLQHHLRQEPVVARPPSVLYLTRKFARRHQSALASAAAIAVILIAGIIFGILQNRSSEQRIREAETRATSTAAGSGGQLGEGAWAQYVTGIANVQSEAALSPDETMLAYVNSDGPGVDLRVHDLKTGATRNLTESEKTSPGNFELCPGVFVWSPDSKRIAYQWFRRTEPHLSLRVVAVQTGEIHVFKTYDSKQHYALFDWMPDGRQVLCCVWRASAAPALALVSVDTGEEREVMKAPSPPPDHVRISPDGRHLVYAQRKKSGQPNAPRNIYLFNLETRRTSQLTIWHGDDSAPIWAPNDPVVLYSSDKLGSWDLWAVRVENDRPVPPPVMVLYGVGDYPKRLTDSGKLLIHRQVKPTEGFSIPFRPDLSATLTWATGEGETPPPTGVIYFMINGKLHTMSPDGSNKTMLPANVGGEPSHTLHGGQRWFLQPREVPGEPYPNDNPRKELFAVREDGDENFTVQLTDHPDRDPTDAVRWATDRETGVEDGMVSWCAWVWDRSTTNAAMVIYAAKIQFDDAGNVIGLARQPDQPLVVSDARSHDWSPQGDKLVHFIRGELTILDLNTGQNTPFTSGWNPCWSPDGTRIAFQKNQDSIHTLAVDGSEPRVVVAKREHARLPPMTTVFKPVWSPDSAYLLFHYRKGMGYPGDVYCMPVTGGEPQDLTLDVDYALPVAWRTKGE